MTMLEVFCNEDEGVYSPSMGAVVSITELIMLNLEKNEKSDTKVSIVGVISKVFRRWVCSI